MFRNNQFRWTRAVVATGLLALASGCGSGSNRSAPLFFGKAALGPDLTDPDRVIHFIVQGQNIYIDSNKDDVPQPEELNKNSEIPLITAADGKTTYRVFELRLGVAQEAVSAQVPQQLGVTVEVDGERSYEQIGTIVLNDDPANATWIHFDGPIRLFNNQDGLTFYKGSDPVEVQLFAGTIARGSGAKLGSPDQPPLPPNNSDPLLASDDLRRITYIVPTNESPKPWVRMEFPSPDGPIIKDLELDKFC